jgi:hypothetical protein
VKTPAALLAAALALTGCPRAQAPAGAVAPQPEHALPHGGTAVVLGDEAYQVELVLDEPAATLRAYVLDGELENFVRSADPSIEITATVDGAARTLVLNAVANPATGESVGDTSEFEGGAPWLATHGDFDGVLRSLTVRGTTFTGVKFNFPRGTGG